MHQENDDGMTASGHKNSVNSKLSKQLIDELKLDAGAFFSFAQHQNEGTLIRLLGRLGRLHDNRSRKPLLYLLQHNNKAIRALAVKNLAKLNDVSLIDEFVDRGNNDTSAVVRRESVSAIGRLRSEKAIPVLIKFLADPDPSVVLQAIRGLLVFPLNLEIQQQLTSLKDHPNESVQEVVNQKFQQTKNQSKDRTSHDSFPNFLRNTVVESDVLETLPFVPDESIHLTFTSPPYYNARDYSIYKSYREYLDFLTEVFKQVHRTTHEGRFLVVNTSPVIVPRISRSHSSKRYPIPYDLHPLIMNIGWEFIDDIVWMKPQASVKNRNAGFFQHRKPLGYKPNAITEMLMVYRKKTYKLIDWNMRQYSNEKIEASKVLGNYETTNVWGIDPTFDKVHSAVFPLELCHRVIRYYSYVEDLVFDPFAGSGTLAEAALDLNRNFFLTELEPKYVVRIKERLTGQASLFNDGQDCIKFMKLEDFASLANKHSSENSNSKQKSSQSCSR